MNEEWSLHNAEMQKLLKQEATFAEGIQCLLALRESLFAQISQILSNYPREAFALMPYLNASGYHSKTLAYSVWHIFRIEDIVAHELIAGDQQVLFSDDWRRRIGTSLITTGNELTEDVIISFSAELDPTVLLAYAKAVKESTDDLLRNLSYRELKRRFSDEDRSRLRATGCVSPDAKADWLVDYWCGKDVSGLIRMPFSRHWIMHTEAMLRIKNKLCKDARKGVDPIACCGFSCNHCFLAAWCGSCRTCYNVCSNATCSADGICPNVKCCREHGFDGCYDCPDIEACGTGFYANANDGNAAKAQALFIRRYGKKTFLKVHDRLHEKNDFQKTQEILGTDIADGLRILESYLE